MKLKRSHSIAIAKIAISFSFLNVVAALALHHHSVVMSKVESNRTKVAQNPVKEALKNINLLKNINDRQ